MSRTDIGPLAQKAPLMDSLRHADRDTRRRIRVAGTGLTMTGVQAFYAQYLVRAKRGLTMSALADYTRTSNANISQMVGRMERHGLVARQRNGRDGRGVIVRITAYGAQQFARLTRRLRAIEKQLVATVTRRIRGDAAGALRDLPAVKAPEPPRRPRPIWPHARGQTRPPWA